MNLIIPLFLDNPEAVWRVRQPHYFLSSNLLLPNESPTQAEAYIHLITAI